MMENAPKKRFSRVEWAWIFYDWANSIWATNIAAAIWPIYFALVVSRLANGGFVDTVYGYAVSLANLITAVLAPFLGAIGDFKGMKKTLWKIFMLTGVVFTLFMAVFDNWVWMIIGFMVSRIGFSGSCLFYDSFLTDITTKDRMDRVSAWGYAMGYIGGSTIPFVISIAIMILMGMSDLSYKIAIAIVPVWWLVFSIPFWKYVEQTHYVETPPKELGREAFRNTIATLRQILKDKAVLFFLIAYFFYIDGVDTIISMATNYGSTLGLGAIGMILALLVTQLVAMPMTILFGNLTKKFGVLRLITWSVAMYAFITIVAFVMGFMVDFHDMLHLAQETAISVSTVLFWILAALVGTVQGGIQALSRSYFGQIIPPERSTEYYGFMDIFGKFACVIGPALYALVYGLTGKACFGILSLILLFICGLVFIAVGKPHFKKVEHAETVK